MENRDLIEYLHLVTLLEGECHIKQRIIDALRKMLPSTQPPQPRELIKPEKKANPRVYRTLIPIFGLMLFGGFIGAAMSANTYRRAPFIGGMFAGNIIGLVIGIFIAAAMARQAREETEAEYSQALAQYESAVEAEKNRIAEELERIENDPIRFYWERQIESAEWELRSTQELRSDLYAVDIVDPKYRDLVMICSLYDILSSGCCTALSGQGGAYELLASEIRAGRVCPNIDIILRQPDTVRVRQQTVCSLLEEADRQLEVISASLEHIDRMLADVRHDAAAVNRKADELWTDSALNAYYNQCAEADNKARECLARMRDRSN